MLPPTHLRTAFLGCAVVIALGGLGPAAADEDPDSRAQVHLERAMALHANARYADALIELTTAYALAPQPEILYAIAQTHVQLGDCPQATLFYQRFLSTGPAPVAAAAAREAIDACAQAPAPAPPPAAAPSPPTSAAPTAPTPAVDPSDSVAPRAWYRDRVGLALVGGGVALGVAGAVTYGLARAEVDRAASAPTYGAYNDKLASARQLRVAAVTLGALGAVGAVLGGVHLWRYHGQATEVAIAPVAGGGLLTVGGGF